MNRRRHDIQGLLRAVSELEQMLVAFRTGDKTRGSGIGLPTVVEIVERHRGRLDIESTPGKGSTFTIALPLTD